MAQVAAPDFSPVYAALIGIVTTHIEQTHSYFYSASNIDPIPGIDTKQNSSLTYFPSLFQVNTKFPEAGELIVKRAIIRFRRMYKRNDKHNCVALMRFIAHLVNQQVHGTL